MICRAGSSALVLLMVMVVPLLGLGRPWPSKLKFPLEDESVTPLGAACVFSGLLGFTGCGT
jgi:hypothetical protein